MSFDFDQYATYMWVSYALFFIVMLWDFFIPRLKMRRVRKEIAARYRRDAARVARKEASHESHS